jgi:RND family efflux transporter MFP subunit
MRRLKHCVPLISLFLIASALLSIGGCHRSASSEDTESAETTLHSDQTHGATVHLGPEEQERMGLEVEAVSITSDEPRVELYGTLEIDPAQVFVVRAPVTGTLQTSHGKWPILGSTIADHTSVASIVPQLTGADQLTLTDRLSTIQAESLTDSASLAASTAEYQRLKTLNADNKNASDRALQEAEVSMKGDQARLEAARRSEQLLQTALHGTGKTSFVTPLIAERGGEVSEVSAQPGETVEAGQALFQISRYGTLIARLNLPLSQPAALPVRNALISIVGNESTMIPAQFVAEGAAVQSEYQSETLLFRVTSRTGILRPGQAIEGWIPTATGSPQSGVLVPFDAVVRYQAQNWVYVQVNDSKFARRPITLSEPGDGGWFVTAGFRAGDRIVVVGAQTLLSEEMKSQLSSDED